MKYTGQAGNLEILARVDGLILNLEAEFLIWRPQSFLLRPLTSIGEAHHIVEDNVFTQSFKCNSLLKNHFHSNIKIGI